MTAVNSGGAPHPCSEGGGRPRAPRLLLLTDRRQLPPGRHLVGHVVDAVAGGVDGVLLRERDLPDEQRCALLAELLTAVRRVSTAVTALCAWPPPLRAAAPGGFHLRSTDPMPSEQLGRPGARSARGPVGRPLVGRSCHDVSDLCRARDERCDYVTLSPCAASASKPGYGPALGTTGFRRFLDHAAYDDHAPRVLALGGVEAHNAAGFVAAGAHGVAVLGALMRAERPGVVAAALREAVEA